MTRFLFIAALAFAGGYVTGTADGFAQGIAWAPMAGDLAIR